MTYNHLIGMTLCDECHEPQHARTETFIRVYWASGDKHYCRQCWPLHRDYYESEGGRQAWKRIGDRYVPIE